MKKIILLLIFVFAISGAFAQVQLKSGLILGAGKGHLSDVRIKKTTDWIDLSYTFNPSIGYKFRLIPARKRYFMDIDLQFGLRKIEGLYYKDYFYNNYASSAYAGDYESWTGRPSEVMNKTYLQLSVNPTFNYTIFDRWYAGIGIEPGVYYVYEDHNKDNNSFKFDMPLTARFGYDFGYMDVAFSYKYGLANISDTEYYTGKIRNWQIQVFIPF